MKNSSLPRPAALQIDSGPLSWLMMPGLMIYGFHESKVDFASSISVGITEILVYMGCFLWLFFWRKNPLDSQSEAMKSCRQEKLRAGFWHSCGQTLLLFWGLSLLMCSIRFLLPSGTQPPFTSLLMVYLTIGFISACVGSFVSWKVTQRMMNAPIEQKKVPRHTKYQPWEN